MNTDKLNHKHFQNQALKALDWNPLLRATYVLSIAMIALIPLQILIFVISPPPESVVGFYELFKENWALGLLSLDFLYIINNAILILIYLTLFVKLFGERPAVMLIGIVVGLIGIACYFPSNPSFEMLTLSEKYFEASPESRSIFVAAGESPMAGYSGTTFDVYYVFNAITLLLFSYAILKSPQFSNSLGIWGLVSGVFMIIPSSAGLIGMIFSLLSLIPWVVFVVLLTLRIRRMQV